MTTKIYIFSPVKLGEITLSLSNGFLGRRKDAIFGELSTSITHSAQVTAVTDKYALTPRDSEL